jgi:hypothetical protein
MTMGFKDATTVEGHGGEAYVSRARRGAPGWVLGLSFFLPLVAMVGYWAAFIRRTYFPSEDEFALIVSSGRMFHPSWKSWFLEGFSRYFQGYPGLSQPATDFIRPVVNASYWLDSVMFGAHWSWYLLPTYAVQAGLVMLSVKLAWQALRLPRWMGAAVGVLVMLSPAFGWQQMFLPSFTADLLGALFVLGAVHELWRKRYISAWVLLAVGLFAKETTLFAPVVVAGLVWIWPGQGSVARRVALCGAWLAPVAAWAMLRHVAFAGHAGVYVLDAGLKAHAAGVLHGLLAWPFGTRTARQSLGLRALYFPLNAMFWAACVAALVGMRRSWRTWDREVLALGLLGAGAFAMPVLLNLPQRFGACGYPLLFLLLGWLARSGEAVGVRRFAAGCMLVAGLLSLYQKWVDPVSLRSERTEWQLAESYVRGIAAARMERLVVVNDVSGAFTSPELVARFAGYKGTLLRANNVELLGGGCEGSAPRSTGAGALELSVPAECGFVTFDSVPPRALTGAAQGLAIQAQGMRLVVFPPAEEALAGSGMRVRVGLLRVVVDGQAGFLYPEVAAGRYRMMR